MCPFFARVRKNPLASVLIQFSWRSVRERGRGEEFGRREYFAGRCMRARATPAHGGVRFDANFPMPGELQWRFFLDRPFPLAISGYAQRACPGLAT